MMCRMLDPTWQAAVLGVLQGLTEFLPVSSSAHLILLPWMLGWPSLGILFDVVLHGGTLLAVLIYFREDWKDVIDEILNRLRGRELWRGSGSLVDALIVGTIPAVIVALALKDWIEQYARIPRVTIVTLAAFGLLLLWADRRRGDREVGGVTMRDALLVGTAQCLALVPGVSRSGITITAALLLGFSRRESARFSFLLATPIIALGALDGALLLALGEGTGDLSVSAVLVGVAVSFVVGYLCIKYFLQFLRNSSFLPFVIYRLVLAGVILLFVVTARQ